MVHSEQIRREVCKILRQNGNENPMLLFNIGLIDEQYAQKWLIVREYWELVKQGKTYCTIHNILSIKYDLSIRQVKYIISKK